MAKIHFLTFLLSTLYDTRVIFSDTNFTLTNECDYTVWPGLLTGGGNAHASLSTTGFALKKGDSKTINVTSSWSGRLWGRSICSEYSTGDFTCVKGDCDSNKVECTVGVNSPMPPTTFVEFTLNRFDGQDFYLVNLVDGYNLPILAVPQGGSGNNCLSSGCVVDLNSECPSKLMVKESTAHDGGGGNGYKSVACRSPCEAFREPQYCCNGAYDTPDTCKMSAYSVMIKHKYPRAYIHPFDNETSTFSCYSSPDDHITFCPYRTIRKKVADNENRYKGGAYVRPQRRKRRQLLWLNIGGPTFFLVLCLLSLWYVRRWPFADKKRSCSSRVDIEQIVHELGVSLAAVDKLSGAHEACLSGKKGYELPLFSFSSIQVATYHFSDLNKLGQGGFRPVYKGKLVDGKEIAVKRLSRRSGQGLQEFKNELMLISKPQHRRNLVKVLGCCVKGEERILIYEYLPNKSLIIFFSVYATKRALLDWEKRLCIIEGIAQGLLYLHKYSRLKIIHRDLKISSILLDSNMNPKISDFGTARIFGEDESRANRNRIVGTYGYMSPKYAMEDLFSVKSDIFSFGVMMLEIVSGKKNIGFHHSYRSLNLLGYAWDLWKEEKCSELMDKELLDGTCSSDDATRCVQVSLLCVQESAADRPTMSDVLSMLSNELGTLPTPKQPAFSAIFRVDDNLNLPENPGPCSVYDVTFSEVEAR